MRPSTQSPGEQEAIMFYVIQVIIGLVCAYFCYTIAAKKGHNAVLFGILGFFFSIITLIVVLVIKPKASSPAA
jgi:hypothetical protein